MGRELQKKKKRSSIPKIKLKPKSKRVNPLGNPIIAANWNQNETLTQNYRRLGLTSRLNTATGGIEKPRLVDANASSNPNSLSINSTKADKLAISNAIPKIFTPTEAVVERDSVTGKILRVIHAGQKPNPLNDPLNADSDDEEGFHGFDDNNAGESVGIIKQLEEQATSGKEKRERKQSDREKEWCAALVERWGNDWGKMVRDRKLNPMQQTEGDIKRRVGKWRAAAAGGGEVTAG